MFATRRVQFIDVSVASG